MLTKTISVNVLYALEVVEHICIFSFGCMSLKLKSYHDGHFHGWRNLVLYCLSGFSLETMRHLQVASTKQANGCHSTMLSN